MLDYKIGVISSSETLTEKVEAEIKLQGFDNFLVRETVVTDAVGHALEMVEQGARVIISRGNTAAILRNSINYPVVDIRHTFFDCYNAYRYACQFTKRVAFLATSDSFDHMLQKSIHLMNGAQVINLRQNESDGDIEDKLRGLISEGVDAAIGGLSMRERVTSLGIRYIMTQTDMESLRDSISEAQHLLRLQIERDERALELENRYEVINSIFHCVSDGIVSVDRDGTITNINHKAMRLLGNNVKGKNLLKIIPASSLKAALEQGEPVIGEVFFHDNQSLVMNSEPIRVSNRTVGATVTLQQSHQIVAMERKIRSIMLDKGHKSNKTFTNIIGDSPALTETKKLAKKYAKSEGSILLLGETGTGKELFAQSIHNASRRRDMPFVAINCAAVPLNILESELFGYVKGAFTGARSEGKAGIFELAHRGTMFLDEISETPPEVQVRLLRVLQEKKTMRIGDDTLIPIDVRIITASNKDLVELIELQQFREDLYYRICVLELQIPPLRERKTDIPALIEYFISQNGSRIKGMTPAAVERLTALSWPGNIRQLGNIIERLGAVYDGDIIDVDVVDKAIGMKERQTIRKSIPNIRTSLPDNLTEMEMIREVLRQCRGNRQLAAKSLGVSITTLWRTMKRITEKDKHFFDLIKYG